MPAPVGMPAENVVIFCRSPGSGPTMSMPGTGTSSLICCSPISALPVAISTPTGVPGSDSSARDFISSAMPSRGISTFAV